MKPSDWRGVTWYLIYCCMMFNFGNVLFGIDVGSFGSLQALPSWLNQFGETINGKKALSTERKSILNSVVWIGKLVGTALFEPILERFGYKKTIYIVSTIQLVAITIELTAKNWIQFSIGRVLAYLSVGIVESTIPSYEAELAPAALRGFFAGNVQVLVHVGAIWGAGMSRAFATETSKKGWMVPVGVQMIPAVALLLTVPWCIESPRWLVSHGRREEAINALDSIRSAEDVSNGLTVAEVEALEQAIEESKAMNHGGWLDLFRPMYLRRTIIVALVFFFQEATGQQFANSYGPTFFAAMGLAAKSFSYSILIAVAGLAGCLIAVVTTDTIGRRALCIIGAALAILFGGLIGGLGPMAKGSSANINTVIASVILLNGVCKLGVASQCWLIGSEIGGTQMRKKMIAWATTIDVLSAFLVTFATPYIQNTPGAGLGARVGFVFMGAAVLALIYFMLFLPELKGRSLEEVDELFERNLWAWQFASAETYGVGARIAQMEHGKVFSKMELDDKAEEASEEAQVERAQNPR